MIRTMVFGTAVALLLVAFGAAPASAVPDESGSADIAEPNGFPGVCDQPCFVARKTFEVFLSGNPDAPAGAACPAGTNTYIYKIEHLGGSGPFVPALTSFEISVESDDVTSAGEIAGFGISPSSTTVSALDVVTWEFTAPTIPDGAMSTKLFICSPLLPGTSTDSAVSIDGQAGLDAPGTCVGPRFQPGGEPVPCTIGFWKNRADGKQGTLQHFPDPEFQQVVDQALTLSSEFSTAQELLDALQKQGKRSDAEKRAQQLAALLLNFAAADLFPDNDKCKVFEPNEISSNACGDGITVGQALNDILAGNFETLEEAKDCADDINNGVGVVGVAEGE